MVRTMQVLIDLASNGMPRAMMRDEQYFPDPETFNPDRFLVKSDANDNKHVHKLNKFGPNDPSTLVFGFGRRCV